jgi:hypothetical protein
MTFVQYMAALQLLAEERTGTRQRQQQGAEDSAFAKPSKPPRRQVASWPSPNAPNSRSSSLSRIC